MSVLAQLSQDDLVKLVVAAEAVHIARQVRAAGRVFRQSGYRMYAVAGSLTAITAREFTGKINHTVSFGMHGAVTIADLRAVEELCSGIGLTPEIYMCDQADPSAFEVLAEAGYTRGRLLHSYIIHLDDVGDNQEPAEDISVVQPDMLYYKDDFVNASVEGAKSNGRSDVLLRALAQCAAYRSDTKVFVAKVKGEVAATAAWASLDSDRGKLANLYIDSTLLTFRGLGLQRRLIDARLSAAKQAGCTFAIGQAAADTPSARNFVRAGFTLAYTSSIFTLGEGSI